MPVYYFKVKMEKPFTYERFIAHDRVPAASLLFRVFKSDLVKSGEIRRRIQAPVYSEG